MSKIKAAILQSGLKQKHISKQIGIEETLFSRYVNGDREIPKDVLKKIANVLKVPIWILE